MNKKVKSLVFVVILLFLLVVIYFVVLKKNKENNNNGNTSNTKEESINIFDSTTNFSNITIKNSNGEFSFDYDNTTLKWSMTGEEYYRVDQKILSALDSSIKKLSYTRETDSKLNEYGLDVPTVSIKVKDKMDNIYSFDFTDKIVGNNTTYFYSNNDKKVFITDSTLYKYNQYGFYNFYEIVPIPVFTNFKLKDISVSNFSGVYHVVTSEENDNYFYYIDSTDIDIDHKEIVNETDKKVLNNYLSEIKFNNAVCLNPTEEQLENYGIKDSNVSCTVNFIGEGTNVSNPDTNFQYVFRFGNISSENDGEYYVAISCTEEGDISKRYNDTAVYTLNSIYAKYFIRFDENRLNGNYRIVSSIMPDDQVPAFSEESIEEVIFENNNNVISLIKKDNSYYINSSIVNSDYIEVDSGSVKQFLGYITQKDLFSFGSEVANNRDNDIINYLNSSDKANKITFKFTGEYEGEKVPLEFVLYIGKEIIDDHNELVGFYSAASNSDHILVLGKIIGNFLNYIDYDYFTGNKEYYYDK